MFFIFLLNISKESLIIKIFSFNYRISKVNWNLCGRFIGGTNSVLDILNVVSEKYEPVPIERIEEFLKLLGKADVVKI